VDVGRHWAYQFYLVRFRTWDPTNPRFWKKATHFFNNAKQDSETTTLLAAVRDYKYRHYMHEIYKKRKPHCNSKTPGPSEIVNKVGPRSEHLNCISRKSKVCRNANGQLISLPTIGPQKSIKKAIADMRERGSHLEQKDACAKRIRDSLSQKKGDLGVGTPSEKTPVLNADDIHQFNVSPDNESDDGYFTSKYIVQCLRLATQHVPIRV